MPEQKTKKPAVLLSIVLLCGLVLTGCSPGASVQERMTRASTYLANGELRSAEIELKNVLQSQPENAQAWVTLGKVSLAAGRFEDAAEQLRRAREYGMAPSQVNVLLAEALVEEGSFEEALDALQPESAGGDTERAKILALRGRAYLGLEKNQQAEQAFAAALSAQPGYPAARVGQARLAQALGDDSRARKLLTQVIASNPDYGPAWVTRGNLAFQYRRCDEVVEAFEKIQALATNALPPATVFMARAHAAHCLLRMDKVDQAAARIDVLMKQAPEHPYVNYLQGLVAYERSDYDQAAVHLQRVISAAPGHVHSLILMGAVKAAQEDFASAEFYLTEALSRSPDSLRARQLLASVFVRRGQPERAVEILKEALSEHGSDPGLLALLAEASARTGNRSATLEYLKSSARQAGGNTDLQLALALRMARAGDADAAMTQLERLNLTDGDDALKAALLRVTVLLQQGETAEAVSKAEALARENPDDVRVLRWLARVYAAVGGYDNARSTLQQAVRSAPDNAAARVDLGVFELRRADYESADRILGAVLEAHPDNFRAMLALAQSAFLQDEPQQALQWLEKAHASRPKNLAIGLVLVRRYLEHGRPADAVPVTDSLIDIAPDNASLHRLKGLALMESGREQEALVSLEEAVALAPENVELRMTLAQARIAQNQLDVAVRELKALRREYEDYLPAASMLALAQLRQGRPEDALATAQSLRAGDETATASYVLTGDLMRAQGKYEAAAEAYATAFEKAPARELALRLFETRLRGDLPDPERSLVAWSRQHSNDLVVMMALAQYYQETDAVDAATELYRAILAAEPNHAVALNNLALIYAEQDDPRALIMAKRAFELAPQSPAIMDTLGWIRVSQGDIARGLEMLREAAAAAPGIAEIQYHLAAALAESSSDADRAEAKSILTSLLASESVFESRTEAETLLQNIQN